MSKVPLIAKMSAQEKIAELERRIAALEKRERYKFTDARATQTVKRVDLEPEMSGVWKAFDALFDKVGKAFK